MEYGIDYNLSGIVFKKDGVRKTPDERTAIIFVNDRIDPGVPFD